MLNTTEKKRKVAAVLFDWDLTLAHVIGIKTYSERLKAIFHHGGLDFPLADIEEAMRDHQINTAVLKLPLLPGVPQTQKEITDYYREILWRLGYTNDDDAFFDRLYDIFAELPLALYEDTLPTLEQLQRQGVKIGIITNHSSLIRPVIEEAVGRYIPTNYVLISQDAQLYKPSPVVFQAAASQLNVLPSNCVYVGDNLYVDAIGAVEQGGYALGLWIDREPPRKKKPFPENVHRITTLSQTLDFV